MAAVDAEGLDEALKAVRLQAARLQNLKPVLKVYGRFIEKNVDDCFDKSQDWDGVPFPPLADSTIEKRVGNLKAANKRTKSGALTKAAQAFQNKLRSPGGIKPLVDTARARNSQHTDVTEDSLFWTAVGYLGFHFTGNANLPQRNVSPFAFEGSSWRLHKRAKAKLEAIVAAYVRRNEVSSEAEE